MQGDYVIVVHEKCSLIMKRQEVKFSEERMTNFKSIVFY